MGSPKLGYTRLFREDDILQRIRSTLGGGIDAPDLRDDAAVVSVPGGGSLVVSVDSVVEGVHVDLDLCSPADVGWKAVMSALSDLAAMGARPVGALVALCVPGTSGGGELTLGVMGGVAEASRESGCAVVGGDVSAGGTLTVAVTVMGTVDGGVPLPRSGAQRGDAVLVTGPCGRSAAGLRVLRSGGGNDPGDLVAAYRRPVARLAEGVAARLAGAHAMIDISDGLALDLHRLADASAVGFTLETVPVAPGATPEEALGGGEDYELLMTMAEGDIAGYEERCRQAGLRLPVRIGTVTGRVDQRTWAGEQLARLGWQHRLG